MISAGNGFNDFPEIVLNQRNRYRNVPDFLVFSFCFSNGPNAAASVAPTLIRHWPCTCRWLRRPGDLPDRRRHAPEHTRVDEGPVLGHHRLPAAVHRGDDPLSARGSTWIGRRHRVSEPQPASRRCFVHGWWPVRNCHHTLVVFLTPSPA